MLFTLIKIYEIMVIPVIKQLISFLIGKYTTISQNIIKRLDGEIRKIYKTIIKLN